MKFLNTREEKVLATIMLALQFLSTMSLLLCEVYTAVDLEWTEERMEEVCVGDQVSMNCTTFHQGTLQWAIEPQFDPQHRIDINVYEYTTYGIFDNPILEVINVTVSVQQASRTFGNITSVILINVTENTIGKHVHCSDGLMSPENSPSLTIPSAVCKLARLLNTLLYIHFCSISINACAYLYQRNLQCCGVLCCLKMVFS